MWLPSSVIHHHVVVAEVDVGTAIVDLDPQEVVLRLGLR